jgi:hypothetical protein
MTELITSDILKPNEYEPTAQELMQLEMNNVKLMLIKDIIKDTFKPLDPKQIKKFIFNFHKFKMPCMEKINLPVFRIGAYACVVTLIDPDEQVSWPNLVDSFAWGLDSSNITHLRKLAGFKGAYGENDKLERQYRYTSYQNHTYSRHEAIECFVELLMYAFYVYLNVDTSDTNTLEQLQENLLLPRYQLNEMLEELTK